MGNVRFFAEGGAHGGEIWSHNGTVVIPAISVGNVAQLAVDLLLTRFSNRRIGFLEDDTLEPCAGNDATGMRPLGRLSTTAELFEVAGPSGRPEATAAVLQIRGNVTPGRQTDHADRLAEWLAAAKPQGVLLLASVPTKFQSAPPDLATRAVSYVCRGPGASERASLCQSLGFTLLDDMSASDREEHDRRTQPWPLLRALEARGVDTTTLFVASSEADNRGDACHMADAAARCIGLLEQGQEAQWAVPVGWQSLFG